MEFVNRSTRNLFFTGKGGLGKTTVACAAAIRLSSYALHSPAGICRAEGETAADMTERDRCTQRPEFENRDKRSRAEIALEADVAHS